MLAHVKEFDEATPGQSSVQTLNVSNVDSALKPGPDPDVIYILHSMHQSVCMDYKY